MWSWDITGLPGPYRGVDYDFYLTLDVSLTRSWPGASRPQFDDLAPDMFQAAVERHGAHPRMVHSDGGPSMTSKTLTTLFSDLGIDTSATGPGSPTTTLFRITAQDRQVHARQPALLHHPRARPDWPDTFVTWYNTEHRHSGLEGHTPPASTTGTWPQIHHARRRAFDQLHRQHPERFTSPPLAKTPWPTRPSTARTPGTDSTQVDTFRCLEMSTSRGLPTPAHIDVSG